MKAISLLCGLSIALLGVGCSEEPAENDIVIPEIPPGVLFVPGEYATIQEAVGAAREGDTILVAKGMYSENASSVVEIDGKSDLLLKSMDGKDSTTVSGQGASDYALHIANSNDITIWGFTFENVAKHAVYVSSSNGIAIIWCSMSGARSMFGFGVYIDTDDYDCDETSTIEISHNLIHDNFGGGICLVNSSDCYFLVAGNHISGNGSMGEGNGVTLLEGGGSHGSMFWRNTVSNNRGAGLYIETLRDAVVKYNTIVDNGTVPGAFSGSGVHMRGGGDQDIQYNTIARNTGGGIDLGSAPGELLTANVTRNIIASNARCGIALYDPYLAEVNATYNDIWKNGECGYETPGPDNIARDPLFCDASNGDYSVASNSVTITAFDSYIGAHTFSGCLERYYDPADKEGVVQNLLLSYLNTDIERYVELLHDDYLFFFQEGDYEPGQNHYLMREEDMRCTRNMFLAANGQYEPHIDRLQLRLDDGIWYPVNEIGGEPCDDCWMTERYYYIVLNIGETTYIGNDVVIIYLKSVGSGEGNSYRILRVHDVETRYSNMEAVSTEEESWGALKSLYRG